MCVADVDFDLDKNGFLSPEPEGRALKVIDEWTALFERAERPAKVSAEKEPKPDEPKPKRRRRKD